MKTMRLITLFLMTVALLVQADSNDVVSSVNIVGYVQKHLPPSQYLLVGVNFTGNNAEEPTLKDIIGTNQLRASSNYLFADRVVIWDKATSSYQAYATYDVDHEFYPCNTADEWNTGVATNPVVSAGLGFWLVPASGASTTNEIYLSGDVITADTMAMVHTNGYQMEAYPFSCDQAIATLETSNLTANANYLFADRISVWNGSSYQAYGLYTDGDWYPCNTADEWNSATEETDRVIALGEGFWFIAQNAVTITETNDYLSAIQ